MSGTRVLTVYYSDTGHTKQIADEIAARLSTTLERIVAPGLKSGFLGMLKRNLMAGLGRPVTITPGQVHPADFSLVIVGSPLWAGHVSSPVRAWLTRHAPSLRHVAFFITAAGASPGRAFDDMAKLGGQNPVACLLISNDDRSSGDDSSRIHDFIEQIETWSAQDSATGGGSP